MENRREWENRYETASQQHCHLAPLTANVFYLYSVCVYYYIIVALSVAVRGQCQLLMLVMCTCGGGNAQRERARGTGTVAFIRGTANCAVKSIKSLKPNWPTKIRPDLLGVVYCRVHHPWQIRLSARGYSTILFVSNLARQYLGRRTQVNDSRLSSHCLVTQAN